MRVLHVVPGMAPMYGGPSHAVREMASALFNRGHEVTVATTTAAGRLELDRPVGVPISEDGVVYYYFPRQRPRSWTFSWPLTRWLLGHVREYEVVHVHALFSYPSSVACWVARRQRIPYVVRPVGTLDPWCLRQGRLKKALYLRLIEFTNLRHAAVIHVTSELERRAVERLDPGVRLRVIPLGVDAPSDSLRGRSATPDGSTDELTLLFLGRLHPKKGLETLIDGLGLLGPAPRVRLVVAGDGESSYVGSLIKRIEARGLDSRVSFRGFVGGKEKLDVLSEADIFVMPSFDENFGVAVAEAMAAGLPVVVTDQVGLAPAIQDAMAGLVTRCDPRDLAEAIQALCSSAETRRRMGVNGRRLVEGRLGWKQIAVELMGLYHSIVNPAAPGSHRSGQWRRTAKPS